jgi:hypothetical protein
MPKTASWSTENQILKRESIDDPDGGFERLCSAVQQRVIAGIRLGRGWGIMGMADKSRSNCHVAF